MGALLVLGICDHACRVYVVATTAFAPAHLLGWVELVLANWADLVLFQIMSADSRGCGTGWCVGALLLDVTKSWRNSKLSCFYPEKIVVLHSSSLNLRFSSCEHLRDFMIDEAALPSQGIIIRDLEHLYNCDSSSQRHRRPHVIKITFKITNSM